MTNEASRGLDWVRKNPGMYTDTSRPNHLAQAVIENSVDEALAGYAKRIDVVLFADGSFQVSDDGRGIPVDLHPTLNMSAVEIVLTHLHPVAEFSRDVAGARGAGLAVVNALSKRLEVKVCRGGSEYAIEFAAAELTLH